MVKLRDIKGLLPKREKKEGSERVRCWAEGMNDRLFQIGELELVIDVEKVNALLKRELEAYFGQCVCSPEYKDRDLRDPRCQSCDNKDMHLDMGLAQAISRADIFKGVAR
jgi:hypothetical protein